MVSLRWFLGFNSCFGLRWNLPGSRQGTYFAWNFHFATQGTYLVLSRGCFIRLPWRYATTLIEIRFESSNISILAWEKYLAPIPEVERPDMMSAYYRRLTGNDEEEKLKCAKAWTTWEMTTSTHDKSRGNEVSHTKL